MNQYTTPLSQASHNVIIDKDYSENTKTLRDEFAMAAMNGELATFTFNSTSGLPLNTSDEELSILTKHWYRIADAMMEARK